MFLWKSPLISKRVSRPVFLIRFLALFTLILAVTLYSGTLTSSAITQNAYSQELIAQSPAPTSDQLPPSASPQIPTSDTALLFQNDRYVVRVFREENKAYVNIYDKENKTLTLKKIPVSITLAKNPTKDPIKYVAVIGNQQYIVLISPLGSSELTIVKGGTVVYRQGSNQVEVAQKVPGVSDQTVSVNPTVALIKTIFINYAKLTLFVLMFSMAIHWKIEDVVWIWKQPSLLLRSLLSVLIAVPLLGALTVFIPGLTVAQRIGIGAMIACPGAPMIPFKSIKAGGQPKFIASLQFTVCVLAIVSIPLTAAILSQFYPNQAWLSPQDIANQVLFAQVLPMGIGVLLAQYVPQLAEDWVEPVNKIAKLMLLLALIILLAVSLEKVLNAGFIAYLVMGLLSIASLVCGHVLGGPKPETRTVLAYATATRNAGLAVLLVSLNFPNLDFIKSGIIDTLITYALIAAIVSIPYTAWRKRTMVKN
ncbi:Putative sodium dependent transporter [Planktothrix tepida]|uniref:Sodium dependent transporter n=2 Tax=Planktothrix TaxID=54304 RepID=A0A9W4G410_9CYAN|nr:Putative sodium dependent transporter [Planktothrix pseudagardhii]CAD5979796.1 Putative sodium dependent transporter [Planktothrix tepida]CUR33531.1 putative sodium dependent transporter [Planktothrix tepida PCC 9214]